MRTLLLCVLALTVLLTGCVDAEADLGGNATADTNRTDDGCMGYDDPCDYGNPGNVINPANPTNPLM